MQKIRLLIIVTGLAAIFCGTVFGQEFSPLVSIAPRGGGTWYALTESGDLLAFYQPTIDDDFRWFFQVNLPIDSGRAETSPFVDLWTDGGGGQIFALTAEGGFYSFSSTWTYRGRIPDLAGVPATGSFISLSYAPDFGAITETGEMYHRYGDGTWHLHSNVWNDLGVVPTEKSSISDLKSMFR